MLERARTRGQDAALAAAAAMIGTAPPHALLIVGPGGSGKTTLALDIAAALLCEATIEARPCRECRACRMVEHANHPDLHRLGPEGPGGQIRIGGRSGEPRGVRDLASALALLPVEGGARVAIVEQAHRMNEDAQSALLKTLEEPPAGVLVVLCADEEERLLPTVRSRCARLRLGPVGTRDIEALLAETGLADAPTAARLARLSAGRPGLALAYAAAPEAIAVRAEIARRLVDLVPEGAAGRLDGIRELLARSDDAAQALDRSTGSGVAPAEPAGRSRGRRRREQGVPAAADGSATGSPSSGTNAAETPGSSSEPAADAAGPAAARLAPAERRRAALFLVEAWRELTRDLALVKLGGTRSVHDPSLLEEFEAVAAGLDGAALARFLVRLGRAGELVESSVSPELVLDSLALEWPGRTGPA